MQESVRQLVFYSNKQVQFMRYQISTSSSASLTIFTSNWAHLACSLLNSAKMTTWAMLLFAVH